MVRLEKDRRRLLLRFFHCWSVGLCEQVEHAAVMILELPRPGTPELFPEYPYTPRARTMTPEQLWPDTDDGF